MLSKSRKYFRLYFTFAVLVLVVVSIFAIRHSRKHTVSRDVEVIVNVGGDVTFDYETRGIILPILASETTDLSSDEVASRNALPIGVIDLSGVCVTPQVMRSVVHLPTFRCLNLHEAELCNESWEILLELDNVGDLWIGGKHCTDEQLAKLDRLSSLTNLDVWSMHLSASTCKAIGNLSSLKRLTLQDISIAKGGFSYFSKLANLESLVLNFSANESLSSELNLQSLFGLTSLRRLYLKNVPMKNDALIHFKSLPHLEYLELKDIDVDDGALEHIAELNSLEELLLIRTKITGNVPNRFERLLNLRGLALIGPTFTDDTLKHLYPMKNLQKIIIRESKVSDEGKESLKLALPSIQIIDG